MRLLARSGFGWATARAAFAAYVDPVLADELPLVGVLGTIRPVAGNSQDHRIARLTARALEQRELPATQNVAAEESDEGS